MGFGQYAEQNMRAACDGKDRGYPDDVTLKYGRMTKADILAGASLGGLLKARKTGHNELTLLYAGGTLVCRLRQTDIVTIGANDIVMIDTGGWNTPTTRRHIMNFLDHHGFDISVWGDKKGGGNRLIVRGENFEVGVFFKRRIMFNKRGGYCSDLSPGSPYKWTKDQVRGDKS